MLKLIYKTLAQDPSLCSLLASYAGYPAIFNDTPPPDDDSAWHHPHHPRLDFSLHSQYSQDSLLHGTIKFNITCTAQCGVFPEDIARRLVFLLSGSLFSPPLEHSSNWAGGTVGILWSKSRPYVQTTRDERNVIPHIFGISVEFDIFAFPQHALAPLDPVAAISRWCRDCFNFTVIGLDPLPPVVRPDNLKPAIYWHLTGVSSSAPPSFAGSWLDAQITAFFISPDTSSSLEYLRVIAQKITAAGEILLDDGSPLFVIQPVSVLPARHPLSKGHILITLKYPVLNLSHPLSSPIPSPLANTSFSFLNPSY